MSLPTRECGLKSMLLVEVSPSIDVTPYAGVWIEIANEEVQKISIAVTPYAGVWIEINWILFAIYKFIRHSLRGSVD